MTKDELPVIQWPEDDVLVNVSLSGTVTFQKRGLVRIGGTPEQDRGVRNQLARTQRVTPEGT